MVNQMKATNPTLPTLHEKSPVGLSSAKCYSTPPPTPTVATQSTLTCWTGQFQAS
jgi:hypothetical protein